METSKINRIDLSARGAGEPIGKYAIFGDSLYRAPPVRLEENGISEWEETA